MRKETLDTILAVLDHATIVQAELRKLHSMRRLPSGSD